MTEEELKTYWGRAVRIVTVNGNTVKGHASYFSDSYDNDPYPACLGIESEIGLIGVEPDEIASIEVIKQ